MKCPNCGHEFEGKFCPECGTKAGPTAGPAPAYTAPAAPQPTTPQKPKKKGVNQGCGCFIALVVAFFLILAIAIIGGSSTSSTPTATPESAVSSAPVETPSPKPSEEPVATAAPEDVSSSDTTSTEADSGDLSLDLLAATLSLTLQENFPNSDVTYDDSSITMSVWDDNIAAGALLAQQGNEELQQSWNEMRGNLRQMCESTKDTISDAGYPDVTVTLNLLNDMNQDNILLTIVDGVVTYDVVYNYEM